jgi:TetR/AcrR family transcriptional regulator, transcriptional repressor for nem operon
MIDINDDQHHYCQAARYGIRNGETRLRLTKEKVEQNRRHIVETASRMFRLHGVENVAVADVMKEAGFTHGGFYNHFESKDQLVAEALACAFDVSANFLSEQIASGRSPQKGLESAVANYLSAAHRDTHSGGCPAAALPADVARNGEDAQLAFADGIEAYLDILGAQLEGSKQEVRQEAIALLAGMVGAVLLSRAVKNGKPKLSNELLSATRKQWFG